jgi:sortase A
MSDKGNKRFRRMAVTLLAVALLLAGGALLASPSVLNRLSQASMDGEIAKVDAVRGGNAEESSEAMGAEALAEARDLLEAYNKRVSDGEVTIASDPFSFEDAMGAFGTLGLEDGLVGYMEVSAMDCSLPLYLGSTKDHMAKGATVVSGSSAPLGGTSSNCVIAAHRGYGSASMFRDIEKVSVGDEIRISTLWEDLTYTVVGTRVIDPSDTADVGVQLGRDLVSLVTCHPYGHNYTRYVVEAERTYPQDEGFAVAGDQVVGEREMVRQREMSLPEIEDCLRVAGAVIIAVSLAGLAATTLLRKRPSPRKAKHGKR